MNWRGAAERIRQLQTRRGRQANRQYTVEGTRLVERALRAGVPLEMVIIGTSYALRARERSLWQALQAGGIRLEVAPDPIMDELTGGRRLGAIVAVAPAPASADLGALLTNHDDALVLVCSEISEPGNVGAMLRTAHALGALACLCVGASDPYHPKAVRTSMGSVFKLPIAVRDGADDWLDELQGYGMTTIATVAVGGVDLTSFTIPSGAMAVLLGDEYYGLPPAVQQRADRRVTIGMVDGIDSFSVNAAAAIVLYEARRQIDGRCS